MRPCVLLVLLIALAATACKRTVLVSSGPAPKSATVAPAAKGKAAEKRRAPRKLTVPPGHYPPPGQCRLWYPGRPPGQQPKPVKCSQLRGKAAGTGAFILYNDTAWDGDYDWSEQEKEKKGSVPKVILELTLRT